MKKLLPVFILIAVFSCNSQTELKKLSTKINKAPQTAFPGREDEKWKLIKELEKIKDPQLPDSVKSIFSRIDTSIKGYDKYRFALLNLLARPDSRESLKVMGEIFYENYISDPSCAQAITAFLMDKSLWGDMLLSYITKKNNVDYGEVLKNVDVMFPNLAHILGKRPPFCDRPILDLLKFSIQAGTLDKNKLASSKSDLTRYYYVLKGWRNARDKDPANGYDYTGYYESHIPDLLFILKVFDRDAEIDKILAETGNGMENKDVN